MVRYERNELGGEANSSEQYAITLGHEWRMGSLEGETSVGIGWTNYGQDHPVFNQKRQATTYDVSMLINSSNCYLERSLAILTDVLSQQFVQSPKNEYGDSRSVIIFSNRRISGIHEVI